MCRRHDATASADFSKANGPPPAPKKGTHITDGEPHSASPLKLNYTTTKA